MAAVALLIGLFIIGLGILSVAVPEQFLTAVRSFQTPMGLYFVAALRVVFGFVLLRVAPASRAPGALRALGFVILIAGLVTPFFGVERARAMMDWWVGQGPGFMRLWGAVAVGLGSFVVYAVRPARRVA